MISNLDSHTEGPSLPVFLIPIMPDHSAFVVARRKFIEETLASGQAVRFTYPSGVTKDIKEFNPTDSGDLTAFRQQGGEAPYICWRTLFLSTEAVDL